MEIAKKPILVALIFLAGCSSSKTTTITDTQDGEYGSSRTKVETVETETDSGGCEGVLSCTVNVLGEVIALPFRAVGALFSAIF